MKPSARERPGQTRPCIQGKWHLWWRSPEAAHHGCSPLANLPIKEGIHTLLLPLAHTLYLRKFVLYMQLSRTQSMIKYDNEVKATEFKHSWKECILFAFLNANIYPEILHKFIPALHTAFLLAKELLIWTKRTGNITIFRELFCWGKITYLIKVNRLIWRHLEVPLGNIKVKDKMYSL